jgi:DNA polymerase III subunit gamma/tau
MAKRKPTSAAVEDPPPTAGAEYTVLARRYRPQQFSDLVGQEPVAQALINAIESNRVAHAYLFTGARGVGKTSAARILAKALNCVKGPTATPCDQCEICQAITSGGDQDVQEIDGASNRGIDEIRELRQNTQYRPTRSRYRIYIIDEVHMLTKEAFNALLKTLEEPPSYVKFIFATTEANKVPITILSRCQRFDFGNISINGILDRLKEIVAAEGMQADDEALETVARRAGGSMRDAQSLLDQLLAFSGQKLTVDTVHQLLGTAHEERVMAMAGAVLAKDAKQVLELLNDIVNQGQQLGELLDQLIEYWRDLMVVNSAGLAGQSVSVSSARRAGLEQHAKQANLDTIVTGMDILVTAKMRMRNSSHSRALLEMALVRLCQLDNLLPIAQIAQFLSKEGGSLPTRSKPAAPAPIPAKSAETEKKKLTHDNNGTSDQPRLDLSDQALPAIWQQILDISGLAVQAELRRVKSTAISAPNSLVLKVSRRYNGSGSLFQDPARLAKVEEALSQIVGQPCKLRVEWTDDPTDSPSAGKSPAAASVGQQRQQRAELMQIPLVKKVTEILNAQIIKADDGFGALSATKPEGAESEVPSEDE